MVHLILKFGAHRRHKIKFRRRLFDADELAKHYHRDEILELFQVCVSELGVAWLGARFDDWGDIPL
jgi:hypothetical protein